MRRIFPLFCLVSVLFQLGLSQEAFKWGSVAIGGGGFVSAVIAAPNDRNVFYVRTDVGGAYRWDETGKTWVSLLDWVGADERGLLGVDGIAVDPRVKGRVYLLAGTSYWNGGKTMFLRSDDYGNTWEKFNVTAQFKAHGNGMGRGTGERLAVDPNNSDILFCGTRWNGLWKSANRGATWERLAGLDVTTTPNESGVSIVLFDSGSVQAGTTQICYAGVTRENDNLYKSTDAGKTWSLLAGRPTLGKIMPQRMALTGDGSRLYVTYGSGGGPSAQNWGGVEELYSRGAVFSLDVKTGAWTDISPVNYLAGLDSLSKHYGVFSGLSIDPTNANRILATSINSWSGPQFWNIDGKWKDSWGDNIFVSEDAGATWRAMFRYYWLDGGVVPDYNMVDANGSPWIVGNTAHWISSAVIDPFNPDRAFVTSGNGVFRADNLWEKKAKTDGTFEGRATWKFSAQGIEETVPLDLVSIPGGPLVSVIGDYDGFVHDSPMVSPAGGRHAISDGTPVGTTTGLAFAAKSKGTLVKASNDQATYSWGGKINPISISKDTGKTWEPVSTLPAGGEFHTGKVALSADGSVIAWAPQVRSGSNSAPHPGLFRTVGGGNWTAAQGIAFACNPLADPENAARFYAYDQKSGVLHVSNDGAQTFTAAGTPGASEFETIRAAPGREGDIWVPLTTGGLTRSTDAGKTFAKIAGVTYCEAVGFGKEAPGAAYPAVYVFGTVAGVTGVFQSIDQGASWIRVNDNEHQYGGLANGEFVVGDANVFGVVYMSTAGRGIAYRYPASWVGISPPKGGNRMSARLPHARIVGGNLHIALPQGVRAELSLYDVRGAIAFRKEVLGVSTLSLASVLGKQGSYFLVLRRGGKTLQSGSFGYFQ